ncbi:MAG TPA: UvrD-helicase domain-containing protein [Bryobacteraceae bacterium]|nr:UvrD-helicase domain-containing protein [Bryobacteraceae bacterium]
MKKSSLAISDDKERQLALDPGRSFIVEAPAGSGKTGLLVQRILRLLSVVERPESVVAMTFTRKAAAEMRERVQQALEQAAKNTPTPNGYEQRTRELALAALKQDSKHSWNLLADGSRLQIQTIDSLCAMLTRQMPVVSEFGGAADVVEDATELYRIAARNTLRVLAESEEQDRQLLHRISLHFDNDLAAVERQIARMLAQRDQWRWLVSEQQDGLAGCFCELLHRAERTLRDVFRQRSTVDFTEVTRAAIKALGTPEQPSDLLYWLDYRIEHLLVDEFQDTSRAQYDLIEHLTGQWSEGDDRTLFLVGDPMQSIYRFREAEVSLFLRCWEKRQLGSVRLVSVRLTTNFRSRPEIVEWTQKTFAPIMCEDNWQHSAVKLRPAEAARPRGKVDPQLIPFLGDNGQEEARAIVEIINEARGKGTVAILVRSRSHITAILPALRRAGIRYEAVEIDELGNEQHIFDLVSLTRALVHAGDRLAWLACLRAPWCGLTLADLSALAEGQPQRTIFDLLSDPDRIASLTPDGRSRALRVQEILSAAIANVGRMLLRDLVEQTWIALGGPAILGEPNQQDDVDTFLNLIESLEEGGIIRDFSLLQQRLECLYAKPAPGADCVRVMTIHGAKGLEFDTVIVPKLGAPPRPRENDLLIWTEVLQEDGTTAFYVAPQPQKGADDQAYQFISDEIKLKETEELKRLFYVACTRAKNELYLLGNVEFKKDGKSYQKPKSNTFLGLAWGQFEPEFAGLLRRRVPVQASLFANGNAGTPATILRRLPASWHSPRLEPSVRWEPELQRVAASARKVTYEWVSDTGRHVGTIVHELLKRAAREGMGAWNRDRVAALAPVIVSELRRLGVPRTEEAKAVGEVIRAVANTLASERGRWVLHAHAEARSEWAIGGRLGDKLIAGVVDRAFRDEEGRYWIVDYKTSEHQGSGLEAFLNEEQRRYRTQLDNYAALLSKLGKKPVWLGLYFPLLDAWREWQFEEEAVLTAQYTE